MTALPPVLAAVGWTLVHYLWQGTIVAGVFGLVRLGSRRSSAESRYVLACSALLVMGLLPLCTLAVVWPAVSTAHDAGIAFSSAPELTAAAAVPAWRTAVPGAMPWVLAVWGLGVGILAIRASIGWSRLERLVRDHSYSLEPEWRRRVELLTDRVGLRHGISVRTTLKVASPIVTGCWRPTVLLPLSVFTGLPVDQLESLILHELVHIKRRDLWVQRAQLVVETLLFHHPAVWWISHVIRLEREYCCDAAVVALTGDRLGYARALTGVETARSRLPRQALASTGGSLMSRIRSIVHPTPVSPTTSWSAAIWTLAALGLVVALTAATTAIGEATHAPTPQWMPDTVGRWSSLFQTAADRHGVDPALLSIVTLVESRGNPDALSSLGAVGLMQIMPATGKKIATDRGIQGFDVDDLRDPATNVDFGAWYLARQIEDFGDGTLSTATVTRVAAAYNGGPRRMRQHLDHGQPLSEESRGYSSLIGKLWSERDEADSAAFDRLFAGE